MNVGVILRDKDQLERPVPVNKTFVAAVCAALLPYGSAYAQHHGGSSFGGAFAGGALGGIVGGMLAQPAAPPPPPPPTVYYAAPPPVVYERRVYVAPPPVYVPPVAHIAFHPWPGPGFACYEPEPNAVNRAICGSEDLSAASLAVVQAVYAAIQQTPYSAAGLRAEYTSFLQSERANCSPYAPSQVGECVAGMLAHERETMAARLTGIYADEAGRPITVHVQLQQRLHAMGLLPGTADGVYGEGTRRAISNWQAGQGHPQTGVLSNEEVALIMPGYGSPTPVYVAPVVIAQAPPPAPAPVQIVAANPAPAPIAPAASPAAPAAPAVTDLMNGVHEGMPYALARPKLFAAGWQTQFFAVAALSDQEREMRQWFIDHHMSEVQDCSSSGCKMQLHNADGRLLYVYTQPGSHASDAFHGAGPSVIASCLDVDDITCPAPSTPGVPGSQQAAK